MLVGLLLALLGLVQALSSAGSRLLVLSDDVAEDQSKYSKFLGDLKSMHLRPLAETVEQILTPETQAATSPSLLPAQKNNHSSLPWASAPSTTCSCCPHP